MGLDAKGRKPGSSRGGCWEKQGRGSGGVGTETFAELGLWLQHSASL